MIRMTAFEVLYCFKKLTARKHQATRGLFATAELLVVMDIGSRPWSKVWKVVTFIYHRPSVLIATVFRFALKNYGVFNKNIRSSTVTRTGAKWKSEIAESTVGLCQIVEYGSYYAAKDASGSLRETEGSAAKWTVRLLQYRSRCCGCCYCSAAEALAKALSSFVGGAT